MATARTDNEQIKLNLAEQNCKFNRSDRDLILCFAIERLTQKLRSHRGERSLPRLDGVDG